MIKWVMKKLGYKVFTLREYSQLIDSVAACGVYYRTLVSNDNAYHHNQRTVNVPLSELSNICLVENCIWEDVKEKINNQGVGNG